MRFTDILLIILVTVTLFDLGMRLDQRALCLRSDEVTCPASASVWADLYRAL